MAHESHPPAGVHNELGVYNNTLEQTWVWVIFKSWLSSQKFSVKMNSFLYWGSNKETPK